jgi:hypothetical protein
MLRLVLAVMYVQGKGKKNIDRGCLRGIGDSIGAERLSHLWQLGVRISDYRNLCSLQGTFTRQTAIFGNVYA